MVTTAIGIWPITPQGVRCEAFTNFGFQLGLSGPGQSTDLGWNQNIKTVLLCAVPSFSASLFSSYEGMAVVVFILFLVLSL